MTRVYFVRHAQPEHDWEEDRTRPLTEKNRIVVDERSEEHTSELQSPS